VPTRDEERPEERTDARTDAQLVTAARDGDPDAFTVLMERYRLMALSLALRLVPAGPAAQDVVQDAMLQAFLSLPRLREPARFKAWFYGILLNVGHAARRPQRLQAVPSSCVDVGLLEWAELVGQADHTPDPAQLAEEAELRHMVREALAGVSALNRNALLLFYFEDLTHQEMARRLGVSLAAVKSRLHKGRAQLRRVLLAAAPELEGSLGAPAPSGAAHRMPHDKVQAATSHPISRRTKVTPPTPSTPAVPPVLMIPMRIARIVHAEPRVLIGLLDPQDALLLPLWLPSPEGVPLFHLDKKRQAMREEAAAQASQPSTPQSANRSTDQHPEDHTVPAGSTGGDFVANLLSAFGATVEHVQISDIEERLYAMVLVHGPTGERPVPARLGEGLFAALRYDRPLLVAEPLATRQGVAVPVGSEPLSQRVEQVLQTLISQAPRQGPAEVRESQPRNLDFGQGLRFWELRGDFLLDLTGRHWTDYMGGIETAGPGASGAGGGASDQQWSAFLAANVPTPKGFADLRQAILADDYRGKRVRLAMTVKSVGVEDHAGPYVRIVDPGRTRPPEVRQEHLLQGTTDWTRVELTVAVPSDAVFLLFGISLTGPGKVWMTQVALEEL
jgi:RNA polymerase sigma factor (sigma-70 family)